MVSQGATRSFGYGASTGRGASHSLTTEDVAAIQAEVTNISAISPEMSGRYQVTAKGTNTNTSVTGAMPAYTAFHLDFVLTPSSFMTGLAQHETGRDATGFFYLAGGVR